MPTIVSVPNDKQWLKIHISDLLIVISCSTIILIITKRKMGRLETHSPTYDIKHNWFRQNIADTYVQCLQISPHGDIMIV